MRISTMQIHQQGLNNLLKQQRVLIEQQTSLATGKRIQTPADDPIGAAQILQLNQQIDVTERYQMNASSARSRLELEEGLLASVGNVLQRVRELHIQASNDTLGFGDRQSIAKELQERLAELVGLANTQDASGAYLFSGYQTATEPFTKNAQGNYIYGGDSGQRLVEVSQGLKIPISDSGLELFVDISDGNGTFSVNDPGAVNTGSAVVGATSVTDSAAYVADTYTITFVTNSSSQLAYQVVGATSGQIIPVLPQTIPNDAPAYVDGQSIAFNGISIPIKGTPAVGDDFEVKPSTGQSMFTTLKNIITALNGDAVTANQKAVMHNTLNQSLFELDQALDTVSVTRIKVGARLNSIDSAINVNDNFLLHGRTSRSTLEDLDYAQAISEFEAKATALEVAQKSFLRIRNLNLMNFI